MSNDVRRLLIVDDEEDERRNLRWAAKGVPNLAVFEAVSSAEAIEAMRNSRFDVVVTDLEMDRRDAGLHVLRAAIEHDPLTQVILVTAYGTTEISAKTMELGAFDYLDRTSPSIDTLDMLRKKIALAVSYKGALERSALTGADAAVEFRSCFISYSTRDQAFANRLYTDLQSNGVRCWFAPEDLKIGDPFRQRIDDAIRKHDKLLLILSKQSVESAWVRDEVESCLERETREERSVLFPVRLDNSVMDTHHAWAAVIRRERHIGDFRDWNDEACYRKAFDRLLRDLRE